MCFWRHFKNLPSKTNDNTMCIIKSVYKSKSRTNLSHICMYAESEYKNVVFCLQKLVKIEREKFHSTERKLNYWWSTYTLTHSTWHFSSLQSSCDFFCHFHLCKSFHFCFWALYEMIIFSERFLWKLYNSAR